VKTEQPKVEIKKASKPKAAGNKSPAIDQNNPF
jgi:hypothetical protein